LKRIHVQPINQSSRICVAPLTEHRRRYLEIECYELKKQNSNKIIEI